MSEPVLEALNLLHTAYPDERVDIWTSWSTKENRPLYTGMVGEQDQVYACWLPTPREAAERLIEKAGDRSRLTMLNKRIAKLQAELAELQAQQTKAA